MTMPIDPATFPNADVTLVIFVASSPGAMKLTTNAATINAMKALTRNARINPMTIETPVARIIKGYQSIGIPVLVVNQF